ncbi:glycosyltransferase [Enterococcus casseliflavus]|jgi:Glycosyltransferases, probably involved in cell wall biogenesis|uniref:glycosyltransferase n=1 Tax=Enterococcus casseliflavus TaxID=37734 RepID=UPI003D0AF071
MIIIFYLSLFLIAYTMVGYPILLELLYKIVRKKNINSSYDYVPFVSIIVPAHNEEVVIEKKILNLLNSDYDKSKFEIIIASDHSTDNTNSIVSKYAEKYPENVKLINVIKRKGKTNAQDEAVEVAKGEILICTDANSFFSDNAIKELVSFFNDEKIGYVAGRLVYTNEESSQTSKAENSYWNFDMRMRKIESDLSSITAGNGSIYAIRKEKYFNIPLVYSHDSIFPPRYVINDLRAVYNENALAYEKAGETTEDEFKRKKRMARTILSINFVDIQKYNFFKFGLFSLFYFSHRFLRNNLYLLHIFVFFSNIFLIFFTNHSAFYATIQFFQIVAFISPVLPILSRNKYFKLLSYYIMTIYAQMIGAFNELTGRSKPFWEKAETTR